MFVLFFFLINCLVVNLVSGIEFSSKLSQLLLGPNSQIVTNSLLSTQSGSVTLDAGAKISGVGIEIIDGDFGVGEDGPIEIKGSCIISTATNVLNANNIGLNAVTLTGQNQVVFKKDFMLKNNWTCANEAIFVGNNYTLDLSDINAGVTINSGASLTLSGLTVTGFKLEKFIFADSTSHLYLLDTTLSLVDDSTGSPGLLTVLGDSFIVMNGNDILLSAQTTFTVSDGASLWLDKRGSSVNPIFSTLLTPSGTATLIDDQKVRILTDSSQVKQAALGVLTSGTIPAVIDLTNTDTNAGYPVVLTGNATLSATDQIVVNNNVSVNGAGSSVTFNNSAQAQVVVPPDKSITFDNVQLLRVSQSTFEMHEGSVVRFKNNTVLEYVEDVHYEAGSFVVVGENSQIILRGLGGKKKITLGMGPSGSFAQWIIGVNTMILEDIEIVGMQYFSADTKTISGKQVRGKMLMTGRACLNLDYDTEVPLLIRGDSNRITFRRNNLSLLNTIRFDDGYDATLHIGFNLSSDNNDLSFALGKDALYLSAQACLCNIILDDDSVSIVNKSITSFVVKSRAVLRGGVVKIKQNPIIQETPDFVLGPGLDLQTDDLLVPIEVALIDNALETKELNENILFTGNSTRAIVIPRPMLTVKSSIKGKALSNTVAVKPGGIIQSFSPSTTTKMNLILQGNTQVQSAVRRSGVVAIVARDSFTGNVTVDNLDTIKSSDKLFVTGTNNRINITGLLSIQGKIVLDENAELIFSFDDSTDSAKAVYFSSSMGATILELPPSASIVFEGTGKVFFADQSRVIFKGSPIEDQVPLGNGLYVDDRPSLIFRNFAQLQMDSEMELVFSGRGKLVWQDGAILDVAYGNLVLGLSDQDFFDFMVDKRSMISVGAKDVSTSKAYVSLSQGSFNFKLDRASELRLNSNGVFEIGVNQGVVTNALLGSISFDLNSKISTSVGGMLAFGQQDLSELSNLSTQFSWSSPLLSADTGGVVAMYTASSTTPFIVAKLQGKGFTSSAISPYQVFKRLIRNTDALIFASDYVDNTDGILKLLTTGDVIVPLESGDILRNESLITKTVYGTSAAGRRFGITASGTKEFYG